MTRYSPSVFRAPVSGSRADASSRQGVSTKGFDPGRGITWFCITVASFAFWYFAIQLVRGWLS